MNIKTALGLGFAKYESGNGKKCYNDRAVGIAGGCIGPLTVTLAHIDHCKKVETEIGKRLNDNGISVEWISDWKDLRIARFTANKQNYELRWELRRSYSVSAGLDPAYQTYWFILRKK